MKKSTTFPEYTMKTTKLNQWKTLTPLYMSNENIYIKWDIDLLA